MCIQSWEQEDRASKKKGKKQQENGLIQGLQMVVQSAVQQKERNSPYIQLNINISVSESITPGWKWGLRETCPFPSQTVFDGLIKLSLPDSMTSIFEELMYTEKVAKVSRLVTPELHIHYMHNWNWIWLNFH